MARSEAAAQSPRAWPRPRRLGDLLGGRVWLYLMVTPIFAFLLLPTLIVIPMSLTPAQLIEFPPSGVSLHSFAEFFSDPAWTGAAISSLTVAAIAIVISVVVGTAAAIALHGRSFRGKGLVVGLVLMPMVVPVVVLAVADFAFLADLRLVGTNLGIGLAHSVLGTPFVYVAVAASLTGLNPELIRSARALGAGPLAVFRHVFLPTIKPGLAAGAVFAFAVSFDEVVIALFLQGPDAETLPVKMFTDIQFELTPTIAAASTLLVILATLILAAQVVLLLRRRAKLLLLPATTFTAPDGGKDADHSA